ncbi:MAG: DNA-directed RNA polymerase subunit omega [Candidatus Eremiobacteraeota bacterium]|nr:DNA-directed RNA polymerase subunit omega [Candidatus Eremiobacteraeota bacterium]
MMDPSIDEILDPRKGLNIDSKFELITMVARRARQINNGAKVLIDTKDKKPVTIAIQEIYAEKIKPIKKEPKRED